MDEPRDTSRQAIGKVWRRARTSRDDLKTAADSLRQLADAMTATGAPADIRGDVLKTATEIDGLADAMEHLMTRLPTNDATQEGHA